MQAFEVEYEDYDYSTRELVGDGLAVVEGESVGDVVGVMLEQAKVLGVRRIFVSLSKY